VRVVPALTLVAVTGFALGACGGGGGGALSTSLTGTRTITRTTPTETVTTAVTTTAPAPAPVAPASESTSNTPWGWIILGVGLAAALLIGILVWHRHRAGAAAWGVKTADLNRRALVALDDVLAKGSVVTGQIEALAAEARRSRDARRTTSPRPQPPTCARGWRSSRQLSRPTGPCDSAPRRRAPTSSRTRRR
jgi:hypothetical protein